MSSQVAVNSRWKANSWICSVISGLRLHPDSWNVRDDKRRPHIFSTTCVHGPTYSAHTMARKRTVHEQDPGEQSTINYVFFSSSGQQNTFYPNLPQITSNIPPWIDSLYFCYKCYVLHIVLTYGGFPYREKIHPLAVAKVHESGLLYIIVLVTEDDFPQMWWIKGTVLWLSNN